MHRIFLILHNQIHYVKKSTLYYILNIPTSYITVCASVLQPNQQKQVSFSVQLGIRLYSRSDKQVSGCQCCEILFITMELLSTVMDDAARRNP